MFCWNGIGGSGIGVDAIPSAYSCTMLHGKTPGRDSHNRKYSNCTDEKTAGRDVVSKTSLVRCCCARL